MPRPLFNSGSGQRMDRPSTGLRPGAPAGHRLLRNKRSAAYLEAVHRLDAGHAQADIDTDALAAAVFDEFEKSVAALPLGIVGCCYLGPPYEVHTLTRDGGIVAHYKTSERLPSGLERARTLARTGVYAAVEVYVDRLMTVHPDGTAVKIEG